MKVLKHLTEVEQCNNTTSSLNDKDSRDWSGEESLKVLKLRVVVE